MVIVYVLIVGAIVGALLFFRSRKQGKRSPVLREKLLSERSIGGVVKMQVVEQLIDTNQVRQLNAVKLLAKIGKPQTLEQNLITRDPTGFIYFATFYDARIRYGETKPEYVREEDHYRRRYEEAHSYGLALRGNEIPTLDILRFLRLRKELNQLSDRSFTRIKDAVEYLSQLPDIDQRLDQFTPRKNYFQLKNINLDMAYLNRQWEIIDKT